MRHVTPQQRVSTACAVFPLIHARKMGSVLEVLDTYTVAAVPTLLGKLKCAVRSVEMVGSSHHTV